MLLELRGICKKDILSYLLEMRSSETRRHSKQENKVGAYMRLAWNKSVEDSQDCQPK